MTKNKRMLVSKIFSLVSHFSFSDEQLYQRINRSVPIFLSCGLTLSLFVLVLLDNPVGHCSSLVAYLFGISTDRIWTSI